MSDLTGIEKLKLEDLLRMENGYILDFSNRSLTEFVLRSTHIDISDEKYNYDSGSKANRLRAFWNKESNYAVATLIFDMLLYWREQKKRGYSDITPEEEGLYGACLKISERLKQNTPVEHLNAIQANNDDKDFYLLAKLIREEIEKNQPEAALDRLHTFAVKYIRELCRKRNLEFDREEPLHSIFGKYVKYLVAQNLIQTQMTERILKSYIQLLDNFSIMSVTIRALLTTIQSLIITKAF